MKKFTAILAALVLTAGMTFAQDKQAPATKGGAAKNNTDKGAAKSTTTPAATKSTTKETKPAGKDAKTPAAKSDKK